MDEPAVGDPVTSAVGSGNPIRTALFSAGVVAALWILLAWRTPTTTYHVAPLLVVLAPVWFVRSRAADDLAWPYAPVLIGGAAATVTTIGLAVSGILAGPTLVGDAGAAWEATILIAAGVVWSAARARITFVRQRRT